MNTSSPLSDHLGLITCDNPSAMTLEGTNTYLIAGSNSPELAVVDPGPAGHPQHQEAILEEAGSRRVGLILLTHRHADHSGGAAALAEAAGAPVRAFDPEFCSGAAPLSADEQLRVGGVEMVVLHTPGHTSDSVSLWLPETGEMLTGDTVLGRGTTMLDYPDGTLTDYFATLDRLDAYRDARLMPAHGPAGAELGEVVAEYRAHRQQRVDQVRSLLAEHGDLTAEDLAELIYGAEQAVHNRILVMIAAAQLDHVLSSRS